MTTYNRSVWWEQVDIALIELIKNSVYYTNKGVTTNVTPIPYVYDMDLVQITYPTVFIKHITETFDMNRYDGQLQIVGVDETNHTAIMEKSAQPYTLSFQLDFVTKSQSQMNDLTRTWKANIDTRFMLDVLDMSGEERKCYTVQKRQSPLHTVRVGEENYLRVVVTLDVKVELDEGRQLHKNVVINNPTILI